MGLKKRVNADTFTSRLAPKPAVDQITPLDQFIASPFKQEITLQHVEHTAGFASLRVRIRERSRFTVFDIDALTAKRWGEALLAWAAQADAAPTASPSTEQRP